MRIDPERLIRLAVLIRQGNFSRAATHLGLTQPALSQSIAQLEREVGVKLIERTPYGAEPTIYGQVLFEHAKLIDNELVQAAQELKELAFGHKSSIRVGTSTGGAASLVALAACRLQVSYPGVDMRIIEDSSIKLLLAQLHDRSLDMLICQRPLDAELKATRTLSLFRAKRAAWVRESHPLRGGITMADLSAFTFVCPDEEKGVLFGFQQIFSTIGLELPHMLVSNSVQIAKEIVLNSDSFALFSDLSVISEQRLGLLRAIKLDVPTEYWMQLILRIEHIPTAFMKAFVAEIMAACRDLGIDVHADGGRFQDL